MSHDFLNFYFLYIPIDGSGSDKIIQIRMNPDPPHLDKKKTYLNFSFLKGECFFIVNV